MLACVEYGIGRSPLGPDGHFGWWDGNIWSNENSQRVADPYTFSHIAHGLIFYWFLYLVARKLPKKYRLIISLLIEVAWEILENSPIIINRYREATIAVGYVGDSILNSVADVVWVAIGFWIASTIRTWKSVALLILMEIGCAYYVRDNLTLNVIMLIKPVPAIQMWQEEGRK
jgi:Protein of unknown function (DUF2585)